MYNYKSESLAIKSNAATICLHSTYCHFCKISMKRNESVRKYSRCQSNIKWIVSLIKYVLLRKTAHQLRATLYHIDAYTCSGISVLKILIQSISRFLSVFLLNVSCVLSKLTDSLHNFITPFMETYILFPSGFSSAKLSLSINCNIFYKTRWDISKGIPKAYLFWNAPMVLLSTDRIIAEFSLHVT